jgi:quinohemoprotein ethanol dehydrogenase
MQAPKNGFFYVLDRVTGEFISAQNYVNVTWTTGLDPKTGRPAMIPEARYLREPAMVAPGPVGAHNWYPMSYSPLTGLVYFAALESASYYKHDDKFEFRDRTWNTGLSTDSRSRQREDRCRLRRRAATARSSSRGIR